MKRLAFLIVVALGIVSFSSHANAQNVQNFRISSFTADYYLSRNDKNVSQLKTVEKISVQFPDFDQNHGIVRAIPEVYKDNNLDLQIQSVTKSDGTPWNYSTSTQNDNLLIKIGDADTYVRGSQSYIITYTQRDVMTLYGDYDEFYWDINGTHWEQPIDSLEAAVHISNTISAKSTKQPVCYSGSDGQKGADCSIVARAESNETVITFSTTRALNSQENISIVMGFQPGTFEKYEMDPRLLILLVFAGAISFVMPIVISSIIMLRAWRRSGRDPKGKGIIVPQYAPPKGANVLFSDVVLHESLNNGAISATIIDLCIRGYLKIYEIEKKALFSKNTNYELEIIKDPSDLIPLEQSVVTMLFSSKQVGERINLSDTQDPLYEKVKSIQRQVYSEVVTRGYYVSNPYSTSRNYRAKGIALIIAGVVLLLPFFPLGVGLVLSGIIVICVGVVMPAKTQLGIDTKEHLLGLKEYMELAEADRIRFLQSPQGAQKLDVGDKRQLVKLYEKLLPYAVLFKIEKEWAKQFTNLYDQGESPSWYSGRSAFNAVVFSSAISSFNSVAVSNFTPPSSSGSSGFGGGGFSGGGGGGGGGGGW